MPKPCLIVSTCGTSLLTNSVDPKLRNLLTDFANQSRAEDVPLEQRQRIQQHLEARRGEFAQETDLKRLMDLSAELNGVIRFYGGNPGVARDQHVLLATCAGIWRYFGGSRRACQSARRKSPTCRNRW